MNKAYFIYAPLLLAGTAAGAQTTPTNFSIQNQQTQFSNDFGKRRQTGFEGTTDLGSTTLAVGIFQGKRSYSDESFSAMKLSGTVYQNWTDKFYTRTNASFSSNKPVYATRELATDLNYKIQDNVVVTVGGKHARYFSKRDAFSLSAGGTWYFGGGFATYRFSRFDVEGLGNSHSHLATIRLKDGAGDASTQLWVGTGTSLHDEEISLGGRNGKFRSVSLRRVQPVKGPVSVTFSLGRAWYDTQAANYRGTTASVGLSFSKLPNL